MIVESGRNPPRPACFVGTSWMVVRTCLPPETQSHKDFSRGERIMSSTLNLSAALRGKLQIAAAAAVVLVLSGVGAVASGDNFGRLAGRFFAPWNVPAVVVPYAIEVKSGDGIIRRGDAFQITAVLKPDNDKVKLPA